MAEFWEALCWFAALFVASGLLTWLGTKIVHGRRPVVEVPEAAVVRIRASSAVYRTRILRACRESWVVAAPLQRDVFVPLRVGESVVVEHSTARGLLRFRSEVVNRSLQDHLITLAPPRHPFLIDRRQSSRLKPTIPIEVSLDGKPGELADISDRGALVRLSRPVARGERVSFVAPKLGIFCACWVLGCDRDENAASGQVLARLRFEEAFDLEVPKKRKTLA